MLDVNEENVKAIKEWPTPESVTKVRSFDVLTSFYLRYIKNFSTLAKPLIEVIKKSVWCKWGENQEKTFNMIKYRLYSAPILALPYFSKKIEVRGNAFGIGIKVVLM